MSTKNSKGKHKADRPEKAAVQSVGQTKQKKTAKKIAPEESGRYGRVARAVAIGMIALMLLFTFTTAGVFLFN